MNQIHNSAIVKCWLNVVQKLTSSSNFLIGFSIFYFSLLQIRVLLQLYTSTFFYFSISCIQTNNFSLRDAQKSQHTYFFRVVFVNNKLHGLDQLDNLHKTCFERWMFQASIDILILRCEQKTLKHQFLNLYKTKSVGVSFPQFPEAQYPSFSLMTFCKPLYLLM